MTSRARPWAPGELVVWVPALQLALQETWGSCFLCIGTSVLSGVSLVIQSCHGQSKAQAAIKLVRFETLRIIGYLVLPITPRPGTITSRVSMSRALLPSG